MGPHLCCCDDVAGESPEQRIERPFAGHLDATVQWLPCPSIYPVFTVLPHPHVHPSLFQFYTRLYTVHAPVSHLGETDGHIFTVNKCQKEEKTKNKGNNSTKRNIQNKNLTKRTFMLHDPCLSLPLDLTRWPLTSNRKWYCEHAQKGSEGFGSPGQLSTHLKRCQFSLLKMTSLPRHFSGSTAKAKIRSAKRIVMDKQVKAFVFFLKQLWCSFLSATFNLLVFIIWPL